MHHRWSLAIAAEFFAMGDAERKAGLPISPFCDRHRDVDISKGQIGFLQFVCRPFFAATARLLPAHQIDVKRLDDNLHMWSKQSEQELAA